jgi:LysR family transcriptional regulator, mexEF-oprN operon transcriptional activator
LVPKHLDLNLLPIAVALYDELNVSRAARQLGMSQPAVSKALRRLRETFDDALFVRGPSGIVPTPRAHAIVRAARLHLQRLQEDLLKGERFGSSWDSRISRRWHSCRRFSTIFACTHQSVP